MAESSCTSWLSTCFSWVQSVSSVNTWALIILAILALFWIASKVQEWKASAKQKEEADEYLNRFAQDPTTIFVWLSANTPEGLDPDDHAMIDTIVDLFAKAWSPYRVMVGAAATDPLAFIRDYNRYVEMQGCRLHNFQTQIRTARPRANSPLLLTGLYSGETFVLCVGTRTVFVPGWDQSLVQQWRACNNPRALLTSQPEVISPPSRLFVPPDYDRRLGSFSFLGDVSLGQSQEFRVMQQLELPESQCLFAGASCSLLPFFAANIGKQYFAREPTLPAPALFCDTHFVFGIMGKDATATNWPAVVEIAHVFPAVFSSSLLVSVLLWMRGYDFFHPTQALFYSLHTNPAKTNENGNDYSTIQTTCAALCAYLSPSAVFSSRATMDDVNARFGMNLASHFSISSVAGLLGLPDHADAEQVLCRFGTWNVFRQAKEAASLAATAMNQQVEEMNRRVSEMNNEDHNEARRERTHTRHHHSSAKHKHSRRD